MSDFLHNLRAKQNKRYDGNRRQYPNQQYQDKRNGKDNRKQQYAMASAVETLSSALTDNLPVIKTILERISVNQEKLARAEERRSKAEERKAAALETFVEYAGQLIGSETIKLPSMENLSIVKDAPAKNVPVEDEKEHEKEQFAEVAEPDADTNNEDEETITRDEILTMICGMREEGLTYDQIAKQLEEESVPTFSGKGKWRGQTVHRLYQKIK